MKVVFCTYDMPHHEGGPNTWAKRLLPRLLEEGIQVHVIIAVYGSPSATPDDFHTLSFFKNSGASVSAVNGRLTTEKQIRDILKEVKRHMPDVFIPNMIVPALYASRWVKHWGIPTIGVMHSHDVFYEAFVEEFVLGDAAFQLSEVVGVSHQLIEKLLPEPKRATIHRIPCGAPQPTHQRPVWKLPFEIVYIGRLEIEAKQILETTEILCQVAQQIENIRITLYGDGSERERVQYIIAEKGEGISIHYGGLLASHEVEKVLESAHAIVLLSDYEGMPLAIMEAMAYGVVPICTYQNTGLPELIAHKAEGILLEKRSTEAVANAIRYVQNEAVWNALSQKAQQKIESSYSMSVVLQTWLHLLKKVTEQKATERQSMVIPSLLQIHNELPPAHSVFKRFGDRRYVTLWNRIRNAVQLRTRLKQWLDT